MSSELTVVCKCDKNKYKFYNSIKNCPVKTSLLYGGKNLIMEFQTKQRNVGNIYVQLINNLITALNAN